MFYSSILYSLLCVLAWNGALASASPRQRSGYSQPEVKISNGTVVGINNPTWNQDFFLGIPFAQPPVDKMRFAHPQPLNKSWSSPFFAQQYGSFCYGKNLNLTGFDQESISYPESEDCLTLNVIRPSETPKSANLPVLVWIYGGGFEEGGSGDARYNMSYLVQQSAEMGTPIIGVSINYRLGAYGFIAGQPFRDQGLTNLGIHDQRLALLWIQENIGAFGGDPTRVTLQGESAGALSIGLHLLANGGRNEGLFQGAIAESGSPLFFIPFPSNETQDTMLATLANSTGCGDARDTLACLQSVPIKIFQNASKSIANWNPIIDQVLFTELSSVALEKGAFVPVPLLIGANTNEGTTFVPLFTSIGVNSTSDMRSTILAWGSGSDPTTQAVDELTEFYASMDQTTVQSDLGTVLSDPGNPYGSFYGRACLLVGDLTMVGGRRIAAQSWADHNVDAYSYRFDTVSGNIDPQIFGAAHYQEVAYVFHNIHGVGYELNPFNISSLELLEKHLELSNLMSRMWISFVNTGSPNHHGVSSFKVTWPKYNILKPESMLFNAISGTDIEADDFRSEGINLMKKYAAQFGR